MNGLLFAILLTFVWDAPAAQTPPVPVTGYNLKWGTTGVYENKVDVGNVLTFKRDYVFAAPNKNCFVVTAYNVVGESLPSNEVCASVPGKPNTLAIVVNPAP